MSGVYWRQAFDRNDPTKTAQKFIKLGLPPTFVPINIDFMSERKMKVKFNGKLSKLWDLVCGSPQGSLIGQDSHLVSSNDNSEDIEEDDVLKYIDDLNLLEIVLMASILQEYNYLEHVPNDIGVNDLFLPPETFQMQDKLNSISEWTKHNLMEINTKKSNYIFFYKNSKQEFSNQIDIGGWQNW